MSAGHTPGPWGIEMTDGHLWIGPLRRDGKAGDIVCSLDVGDGYRNEFLARQAANARLIASAPELLEALATIAHGEIDKDVGYDQIVTVEMSIDEARAIAEAAIAKATGAA